MKIIEALNQGNKEEMAKVLYSVGMHCLGCALASGETIEQAAEVHSIDVDNLVAMLNEAAQK